jgi:hypothetical protein
MRCPFGSRKFFASAASICCRCGVTIELRPTVPNVPSGDSTNEAGSYQRAGDGSDT